MHALLRVWIVIAKLELCNPLPTPLSDKASGEAEMLRENEALSYVIYPPLLWSENWVVIPCVEIGHWDPTSTLSLL